MNTAAEKKEFAREELLQCFVEAFNEARRHLTSPGTRDLEVKKWEELFSKIEEKILFDIADGGVDTTQKLKKYFKGLSIEWANAVFRSSWNEVLNYKSV